MATKQFVAPLVSNPIMSGRSLWSFRHLKHQNLSIGDVFSKGMEYFLVPILATKEALAARKRENWLEGTEEEQNRILLI